MTLKTLKKLVLTYGASGHRHSWSVICHKLRNDTMTNLITKVQAVARDSSINPYDRLDSIVTLLAQNIVDSHEAQT